MANLIIAVAMTAAITALIIFFFTQKSKKVRYRLPPGPPGLPIIGNLHQITKTVNLHRFLFNLSKIYGPILSYKLGCQRVVVVSSPELAKEVLKTQDANFANRPDHRSHTFLTYGRRDIALNHYNPYYLEMKKMIISHLFSQTRVTGFQNVRGQEVKRLIDKVSEAADKSQIVDLTELLLTYTNSVVCRQAFGKRYNEHGDEMKRFIKILYETQALWGIVFYSDIFWYFKFLDDVTGLTARMKEAFKMNDSYLQELIDETRDPNRVKPETKSMIDLLMEIYRDQPFSSEFTLENIKAIILDIMVAGTDTAAGTIEWGMAYLMKYPEVMKKAQTEIRNAVGKTDFITVEDIENLPYFKALVKETLRIEPTIPLLAPRSCIKDTKIAGYDIPAGTTVNVNAWAISHDERTWGENPDQFRPDRFIDKDVDFKGMDFELIPFGSGRRMCPAIRLAVAMVELPFANLLYEFDFEFPTGMKAEDINMDVTAGVAARKAEHLMLVPTKSV